MYILPVSLSLHHMLIQTPILQDNFLLSGFLPPIECRQSPRLYLKSAAVSIQGPV